MNELISKVGIELLGQLKKVYKDMHAAMLCDDTNFPQKKPLNTAV